MLIYDALSKTLFKFAENAVLMRKPAPANILFLMASLVLVACEQRAVTVYDQAADELPFVRPAFPAFSDLPGAGLLPESTQQALARQRAFFGGDFSRLDDELNAAHRAYVAGESQDTVLDSFIEKLEGTQLAGIGACREWLAAKPESYAAHFVCAGMWAHGAWAARGDKFASKVPPIGFALMRERLQTSNTLLEKAITLSPKPVEALALMAHSLHGLGDGAAAESLLARAEALLPSYERIHAVRVNFALGVWGGSREEVAAALDRAKSAGLKEDLLLNYRDDYLEQPAKTSVPGAERAYWERVLAEHPTRWRYHQLLTYFRRIQNWAEAALTATRIIEIYPDSGQAYLDRAEAHEKLGNIPAAVQDYREAAARGKDYAVQTLIRANIQGSLALPAKNWDEMYAICRYGATLGLPSAANCMGSMYWEGDQVGDPFKTDVPQAFAWHLLAARAGYHNSQFDLGWLMMSGRAPGVAPEQAQRNGLFWLRRAAEQNHEYAKKKLYERGEDEQEVVGKRSAWQAWMGSVQAILARILGA